MSKDQGMPNAQAPIPKLEGVVWLLVIGHCLVIGHWFLVIPP
jgi:hypothetical protein